MKKVLLTITLILIIFQLVVLATAIDMGNPAVIGNVSLITQRTFVDTTNSANASGKITSVEVYAVDGTDMTGIEVGTFYVVSGLNLSTRDTESVGDITGGGYKQYTVDLDVVIGDYIGIYAASSNWRGTADSGTYLRRVGDNMPCTNALFNSLVGLVSVYATGTTAEAGGNAIMLGINF